MEILVLGGTAFLGRHFVEAARAAGHVLTLFNRGRTNPDLFDDVERLRGERNGDLSALEGRRWDAVVDTCGYLPRLVRRTAEQLVACGHYSFVSSVSAYGSFDAPSVDEASPLGTLADPSTEQIDGETYGPLKALCERAVEEVFPGRSVVVRPGLIVGPHDPTDRFTYWPRRVARGGRVLAPGSPQRGVQFIDARDLAAWMLSMIERGATGTYNTTGPERPLPMGELVRACVEVSGSDARIEWIDEAFLLEAGVTPWTELPLWIPEGDSPALSNVDCSKAIADGLRFRPVSEIVCDTLAWDASRAHRSRGPVGLSFEREAEVLGAWDAR